MSQNWEEGQKQLEIKIIDLFNKGSQEALKELTYSLYGDDNLVLLQPQDVAEFLVRTQAYSVIDISKSETFQESDECKDAISKGQKNPSPSPEFVAKLSDANYNDWRTQTIITEKLASNFKCI